MIKNTLEIGQQRILDSLILINRFGWISSVELGKFFWRESSKSIRNVSLCQILNKMETAKLIAIRKLPGKNGKALVLLTAGVRLLAKNQITARNGKDIGKFDEYGNWIAPRNWSHDLLTQRFLIEQIKNGKKVMTERELRQCKIEIDSLITIPIRYPDGIIFHKGNVISIETENSSKTGQKRDAMIKNLIRTHYGKSHSFNGHRPNYVIVIADEKSKIDHKKNIENALKNIIEDDIKFGFCKRKGGTFQGESVNVQQDEICRIIYKLRHLQIDEEGHGELEFEHKSVNFKIYLSKFKKIYTWRVFIENGEDIGREKIWKMIEEDYSGESFIKIKDDIAPVILNNS